jgi:hypothetical protein
VCITHDREENTFTWFVGKTTSKSEQLYNLGVGKEDVEKDLEQTAWAILDWIYLVSSRNQ